MKFDTARSYARHLASYISSPTKIEALVKIEWSRNVPPLHEIAEMRFAVEQANKPKADATLDKRIIKDCANDDGSAWKPRSLVRPVKIKRSRLKPVEQPRARDYIFIEPALPAPPPQNPFLGRVSTGHRLIQSVAYDFGLHPAQIVGAGRSRVLVHARAVVAALLRLTGRSFADIGRTLNRDHSSIMHLVDSLDTYRGQSQRVGQSYDRHEALFFAANRQHEALAA